MIRVEQYMNSGTSIKFTSIAILCMGFAQEFIYHGVMSDVNMNSVVMMNARIGFGVHLRVRSAFDPERFNRIP